MHFEIRLKSRWLIFIVLSLVFVSACTKKTGLTENQLDQLKNNPADLVEFEKKHGKIGSHALPPLLLKASKFLDRPMRELAELVKADHGAVLTLTMDTPQTITANSFLILAQDIPGGRAIYFDTVEFENTTSGRVVLIFEAIGPQGKSQAFVYTELEQGGKYSFKHNDPTRGLSGVLAGKGTRTIPEEGTKVIMKGTADGFNFATASLDAAFNPERKCALVEASVLRNQCIGNCSSGTCKATSFESFWYFGEEPATCGCR